MKKLSLFAIALLALLSCQKEGADLSLTTGSLSFDSAAGVRNVVVNTKAAFTVEYEKADWYEVSYSIAEGMGYGTVSIKVEQNKSASSRSGEITIVTPAKREYVSFTQSRPAAPSTPSVVEKKLNAGAHVFTIEKPADYEAVATPGEAWITVSETKAGEEWTVTLTPNESGASRSGEVAITTTDNLPISSVLVEQAAEGVVKGDLVIEEIFFTGYLLPNGSSSTASSGDQYIKITNNSSETVYADGLLFCMSSYHSQRASTGSYWAPREVLTDKIGISTAYAIPGDGDDVPVGPGESVVIAISAQDFSGNGGTDLSGAQFEIYVDFYGLDTDNPDVPNLDLWFKASSSVVILHQRGYESYALVMPPAGTTAESIIADYPWVGEEDFYLFGELYRTRDILSGNYAIPNEWVIDAVNCGVEQFLGDLAFNAGVDAGYTGCGSIDSDPDRFGKSALRNRSEGKLTDTDNSTNDFTRDATPTLN